MATIRTSDSQSIYDLKYPGAAIDAILDTAYDLQNAGYIFRGLASEYSTTPTERSWVLAGEGETGHGFTSPIPKGYIGVCVFNGTSWTGKLLKCVSIDSTPTSGSTNALSSGGAYASINNLATFINEALDNLTFTDTTPSAFLGDYINMKVSTTDGGLERILTYFTILAATTSKAGLMSAADKAKVDAFLDNLRSLSFTDTTASADQETKITETLKATIGGVQEVIDSITLLAATSSKAGLLSASDKAYIDALPATLTSLSNSISGALALMQSLVGYYVCDTAAGTAAKTVAATGYSLTNGGCIRIKMNNANTANNVTLNINSTGAKALYYDGAQASSTNTWEAGEVLEVYYDGTQYQCASGGGGKFATGEKVKETSITDTVSSGSIALPTSGAVDEAINNGKTFGSVDLPLPVTKREYFITTNGTHGTQKYSYHKTIAVESGMIYKIVSNSTYNSLCAFTTDADTDPTSGSIIPLTSDNRIYELSTGITYYIKAPSDAKYLVYNAWYGTNASNGYSVEPQSISMMLDASYLNKKLLEDETPYEIIDTEINTSSFTEKTYPFTSAGRYVGSSSIKHYTHSVVVNDEYIITAGEESINIGWLKSNATPVANKYADLSFYDGNVYVLSAQETIILTAPQDAVSIIVSVLPSSIIMRHAKSYNEQVVTNTEDIDDLREDVDKLNVPLIYETIPATNYNYCIRNVNGTLNGNSSYKRTCVPVVVGKTYRIIASSVYYNFVGWLTGPAPTAINNAIIPTLVPNTVCTKIPAGQYVDLVAPEGAVYLSINVLDMVNGAITDVTPVVGLVLSLEEYLVTEKYPETIFDLNPDQYIRNLIVQAKRNLNLNGSGTSGVAPLSLLHLSDIHGDAESWGRMISFMERYREYIDDAICTGDVVANTITNDKTFLENGGDKVMLALGNHDVAKTAWNVYDATAQECYVGLFQPYIEDWGVVRPENATYECYYYKDYATQKIRLIVLDTSIGANSNGEHWNATQLSWLQTVLESARTNGYSVIIAQHYWAVNSGGRTYVDCTFTCKNPLSEGESIIPEDARTAVQTFIDAGGTFICWLSGHTHRDFVYYPTANPKQLGIVVDCASGYTGAINVCDEARVAGAKSIDAFNIISFDTRRKIIKIVRVGSDTDSLMRHKGVLSIQYGGETPEVIFNN